jgi:hypothetical protein
MNTVKKYLDELLQTLVFALQDKTLPNNELWKLDFVKDLRLLHQQMNIVAFIVHIKKARDRSLELEEKRFFAGKSLTLAKLNGVKYNDEKLKYFERILMCNEQCAKEGVEV